MTGCRSTIRLQEVADAAAGAAHTKIPKVSVSRTKEAEETFATVAPLMPRAGITRLADLTGLDHLGINVFQAVRPNSKALSVAQGKGPTSLAAKVSALMEALESFHAERADIPVRLLSWSELSNSGRAIDPASLPGYLQGRMSNRRILAWTPAFDLVGRASKLVPLELVHTALSEPPLPGGGIFVVSSNGLASGNTYSEAVCHGLCEVIERDAFAAFLSAASSAKTVSPAKVGDTLAMRLAGQIEASGSTLKVRELHSRIRVPVFFAEIAGGSPSFVSARSAGGLGCHPDRGWACARAILEAAQSRLTRLSGCRDDLTARDFQSEGWFPKAKVAALPEAEWKSVPSFWGETVEDDVAWLVQQVRNAGFHQVFVVDLTRPDFEVPVVRVIVPGLDFPPNDLSTHVGKET